MPSYRISCGSGKAEVKLKANYMGQDLVVRITAGKAHIGAVALAVPCPQTAEGVIASCSVMTVPGHRDNIPAESTAMKLCKALGCVVNVTAGLHIDNATKSEIEELVDNSNKATEILIKQLEGLKNGF